MKKYKKIFSYLWNNLYNKYSVAVLNCITVVEFFIYFLIYLNTINPKNSHTGDLFYFFIILSLFLLYSIIGILLLVIHFFEEKRYTNFKIKDNLFIKSKLYRFISIVALINILAHAIIILLFVLWNIIMFFFEDSIRYYANIL